MKFPKLKHKLSVWQYLALGYFAVIVVGTVLLVLPPAKQGEGGAYFIDALFTAVSAACVTGLVPFASVQWTLYGQIVILILIQLGGLGFMTFVSLILLAVRGGLKQYQRRAVLQAMGGVKRLIRRIILGTMLFEVSGAGLLCIRFIPEYGVRRGIYYAVFHAVSSFCNAGFDVIGTESLSKYATDPLVSLTLCVLIIVGGLGFCILQDVVDSRFRPTRFQFYTRVILCVNTVLLVGGTALFLLFERNNPVYDGYTFGEKLLCALFNSTTARTAGFYTTPPETLSSSGYFLMVILMFIGGSSGSTAGGIKVGTFVVIVMGMVAVMRGKRDLNIGKRRIDMTLLWQSLAILTAYLALILVSTMLICAVEPAPAIGDASGYMFRRALFECVSALGTVGLSVGGFTESLSVVSKLVLIFLMYTGRVGILTVASAMRSKKGVSSVRKPVDMFFIG